MKRGKEVVAVGKYLTFSNTSVCGKDVLGIDIKDVDEEVKSEVVIPGTEREVKVDLSESQIEKLAEKVLNSDLLDNLNKSLQKCRVKFKNKIIWRNCFCFFVSLSFNI